METPAFDIIGIGNAIVDVVSPAEHQFLSKHDMHPGSMALIDSSRAETLYAAMPPGQESSGGSAANTCAVAAALGARVAYLGKVAADPLGDAFRRDIAAAGVHFASAPLAKGAPTARCLILVTPDGQRTMNTFLGACVAFGPDDVDPDLIASGPYSTWKATCSIRRPRRRRSGSPRALRARPGARWRCPSRMRFA